MCAIGAPQSRDPATVSPSPGINGGSDRLVAATARADAIEVETVDAEVYAAGMGAMVEIRPILAGWRADGGRSTLE